MNMRAVVFPLVGLLTVSTAYAAETYIGLGLGQSEINQGFFGEYGDGYKLFGGVRVHPNLAIELAYTDFGDPREDLFGAEVQYEAWAVGAWAKGLLPVTNNIELFAKAGLAYWDVKKTSSVFGSPPSSSTADGTDFAWGVGAAFNHWEPFSIQLEYEDINSDLDTITLWSVSGVYRF